VAPPQGQRFGRTRLDDAKLAPSTDDAAEREPAEGSYAARGTANIVSGGYGVGVSRGPSTFKSRRGSKYERRK
jgi:hypothetical protein